MVGSLVDTWLAGSHDLPPTNQIDCSDQVGQQKFDHCSDWSPGFLGTKEGAAITTGLAVLELGGAGCKFVGSEST